MLSKNLSGSRAVATLAGPDDFSIVLHEFPQGDVLAKHIKNAGIDHDAQVIGNIYGVELEVIWGTGGEKITMRFGTTTGVKKVRQVSPGRKGNLPDTVTLPHGLFSKTELRSGRYNLRDVNIYPNGSIQITPTPRTEFKLIEAYR
jgi:hypothetical protein